MSNKTTLQSNNALISQNNTDLQALINTANALPDAGGGGGGSVETCTLKAFSSTNTTATEGTEPISILLITVYKDGEFQPISVGGSAGITVFENVVKNSGIYFECTGNLITENIEILQSFGSTTSGSHRSYAKVTGNAFINAVTSKPCFVQDTPIRLSNGSEIAVQNITYDDELLVWDFDEGRYSSAKPLWIKRAQAAYCYYLCEFANGLTLKLVGSNGKCHRVFNMDSNSFESATDCVGKLVMTQNGVSQLVKCEKVEEAVYFYNIITTRHLNLFANSVLTSCRLNNLYPVKDMRFVKEERQLIQKEDYIGVDDSFYHGLRLSERVPEDIDAINDYVKHLQSLMLQKEV